MVTGVIGLLLAIQTWIKEKSTIKTGNGILKDSKVNMRDYIIAVLTQNENDARMNGLSDNDLIETYGTSLEIMSFNDAMA